MKRLLPILLVFALSGCFVTDAFKPKATKKPGQDNALIAASTVTDTATKKADAAAAVVEKKDEERDAKVKANILHARTANESNPDGPPKVIVDGDLGVAESHLADVQPDPKETAARERDAKLVESGKASEARASYAQAAKDALTLTQELTKAKLAEDAALKERDAARDSEQKARETFIAQLEKNKQDNQRAVDELKRKHQQELDAERKKMLGRITYGLIICAGVCVLLGGFLVYSTIQTGNIPKAVLIACVSAGGAALCVTMAWTINQPWFKWVVIGSSIAALVALIFYVQSEIKDAKTKKTRLVEADEAEETLLSVQKVLDKELPKDHPVFEKLSNKLDRKHKALLNELKAEAQRSLAA